MGSEMCIRDRYKSGIEIGIHYNPNHNLSFFKSTKSEELLITNRVYQEIVSLPIHPDLFHWTGVCFCFLTVLSMGWFGLHSIRFVQNFE